MFGATWCRAQAARVARSSSQCCYTTDRRAQLAALRAKEVCVPAPCRGALRYLCCKWGLAELVRIIKCVLKYIKYTTILDTETIEPQGVFLLA